MKPTTESIITALRSGLATKQELADHHGVAPSDILRTIRNVVCTGLATRELENGEPEYKLTEKGRNWKPNSRGKALRAAMWKQRAAA